MTFPVYSTATITREKTELRRLESLVDTVFAIVLVMITVDIPVLENGDDFDLSNLIAHHLGALLTAALGIVVVLTYWFQSNMLLGNLARTNTKHALLSILQVFFILTYLLAVGLGIEYGTGPIVLVAQSVTAATVGLAAAGAWWYASNNRSLLSSEITDDEVKALRLRVLAEPLTAVLTIALAFVSPLAWELGWLAYPLFAKALKRSNYFSDAT